MNWSRRGPACKRSGPTTAPGADDAEECRRMGAWGEGLLDNDAALDFLVDLSDASNKYDRRGSARAASVATVFRRDDPASRNDASL